jgi:hypothetical protein
MSGLLFAVLFAIGGVALLFIVSLCKIASESDKQMREMHKK